MIKTKIIGLVLAGTLAGGGIVAGIISQINANTQKATTQISQSTNDLRLASGAIDTAQKTIVTQNNKLETISAQQKQANTNLAVAQKSVQTQQNKITDLQKQLDAKNATIADLQKQLKNSQETTQVYINETQVLQQQLWVANTAVGQLQNDLSTANNNNANLQKQLNAEKAKVADLQKQLKNSQETTQVYINETQVLQQQLWVANTAVGQLQNDLSTANTSLATANQNLATKTKEVENLQAQVKSLKAQLTAEQNKNAAQASDITKLKEAVTNQTKELEAANAANTKAQANFQNSLKSFNNTVKSN